LTPVANTKNVKAGKDEQLTIKVPKGTQIKKGDDHLFLPGLKGNRVTIAYVMEKGGRVAKSIEVTPATP
jgi:GTPase involved in cell partitioning and DNA repair